LATAGWILSDKQCLSSSICCGVTQVPGQASSINAYRAELYGIHTLLLAINSICTKFNISQGHVTIGCDNKGVISQMTKQYHYVPCSVKHTDIIRAILSIRQQCPISLSFHYVAGHQDEFSRPEELPPLARLNITADSLARQELHRLGQSQAPPMPFFTIVGEAWYLALAQGRISSNPSGPLLEHLSARQALPYWQHKHNLSNETLSDISWDILGQALADKPPTYRMWVSKFSSGHSAIGKSMAQWGQWQSDICPACQTATETTEHVLFCRHPIRSACWHQQVAKLMQWMREADTHPDITATFENVLSSQGQHSFCSQAPHSVYAAAFSQDKIGIFGLLTGRLSSLWISVQSQHYLALASTRIAMLWAKRLCQQLLSFSHSMWLLCNQQIKSLWIAQEISQLDLAIRDQFNLGLQDLLPTDQFYVVRESDSQGFDLASVLAMDISDKCLWLATIQDARERGRPTKPLL